MTVLSGGIIAAGDGSRLKQAGLAEHKPMVKVDGFPLIGHALRHFQALGLRRAVIIFNEREGECVDWVKQNFSALSLEFIVKSTASSFESFSLVGRQLGAGRHLISTVDALCLPGELKKMTGPSNSLSPVRLGLTQFVDDEKPLWVEMDEASGRISRLGGASGNYVTAGFYSVSGSIFLKEPKQPMASLRKFLQWLLESGVPIEGTPLAQVVDIDHPRDISVAEAMLKAAK